jgi:acylphosphatase
MVMKKIRAHVFVSGLVQGVFFRQSAKRRARDLGVMGWARNMPDGRVEAAFEGDEPAVNALVDYCRHGPAYARVDKVEVSYETYKGEFNDFATR